MTINETALQIAVEQLSHYRPDLTAQMIRKIIDDHLTCGNEPQSEGTQDVVWAYQRAEKMLETGKAFEHETMLRFTDDLVIEVCPGGDGDHPLIKVWSISQEADSETPPGTLVVWAEEIRHLVDGLIEAAKLLRNSENGQVS